MSLIFFIGDSIDIKILTDTTIDKDMHINLQSCDPT